MSNPKYVKIDDELFPINTDFRVALECNKVASDTNIGDYERALAVIYMLFGEKGLNATTMHDKLIDKALRYISLLDKEKPLKTNSQKPKFELDFNKCEGLIKSSFKYDYGFDPYEKEYMHWYDFYNDLQNLSSSELGDCCILNRVNLILGQDASKVKDNKERQKLVETQQELAEKYCIDNRPKATKKQMESAKAFYEKLGIKI